MPVDTEEGVRVSWPDAIELPDTDLPAKRYGYSSDEDDESDARPRRRCDGPQYRLVLPEHLTRDIPEVALGRGPSLLRVREVQDRNPLAVVPYVPPHEVLFGSLVGAERKSSGDMDAEGLPYLSPVEEWTGTQGDDASAAMADGEGGDGEAMEE